ncbi:1d99ca0c-0981-43d1-a104-7cb595193049 [Thermothielavioides terrestris]|uniref:1d99ca0c-0981-43d1-a104-7cb595193049 n=1 Tax=Thermothielavioides terrestris TaxID=2587410 RepID=A0A3S4AV01_9PEZI|nr:1d99ca0c-0981-43d1-a104-7cb595193049 [Thermothielavioides terrestris]
MNRFRTKKRAKDDLSAGRSSEESEQSSLSFFRKGKKTQQEEVKKEFDLATALPSNDDFRTSLLMANLSARFSMLREQDDPNTKIGKASDDSVLFPKRQSRLADFGFGGGTGLSDIAEVESIRGQTFLRTTSVASDDRESENGGSVLTRSRPTEGNNLFGGRQKIYKISANSGSGLRGRALYEDDVALSAFQRWRIAEKEKSLEDHDNAESESGREEDVHDRPESPPPVGYNRKRETASTTSSASIMARNSTAATSIASQAAVAPKDGQSTSNTSTSTIISGIPERSVTRTRRLYEQNLNQDMHEQQTSVLSRIEHLTRPRAFGTRTPDLSVTGTSQNDAPVDRFASNRNLLSKGSAPNLRSTSPTGPSRPIGTIDLGVRAPTDGKPSLGGLPPLSPPVSETGELPTLPILPKDVGKATALGIFQKPTQPYDESQYVERQRGVEPRKPDAKVPPYKLGPKHKRQSALPTPLSVAGKMRGDTSPIAKRDNSALNSQQPSPEDSPTLGPTAGLSGLVRQHLRTESVDSSLDAGGFEVSGPESSGNAWSSSGRDMARLHPGSATERAAMEAVDGSKRDTSDSVPMDRSSTATEDETDEFANQLAEARRRVREKLTSYVESDSSRAASPQPGPADSASLSSQSSNPLGILKPKSSRGSLIDRSRNMVTGQSKGLKILGLGAATMSTSPLPGKQSFEEKEFPALETMKEEGSREDIAPPNHQMPKAGFSGEQDQDEDNNTAHPGLKAFRQARRELQRRKELETLARHQASQTSPAPGQALDQANGTQGGGNADRGPRQRTPSGERRPPPVTYRQRPPSDEHSYSSPGAARPSGERSRSGSEASGGGSSSSRPPRLRTNTNTGPQDQLGPPHSGRPVMRSPGLPGTDIKGSPMMPPYPYPGRGGAPSPAPSPHLERSRSAANLAQPTGRPGLDPHSGQPSPISPMGLPSPAPYAMGPAGSPVGTPTSLGPRPRQASSAAQSPALGPANGFTGGPAKRAVDKRDISEPTFMMSTSQVPTTSLPHHSPHPQYPPPPHQAPPAAPGMGDTGHAYGGPRSRSNSRVAGSAPPVPPINPRRRREDSRNRAPSEAAEMTAPRPPFASHANSSTSSVDYDDNRNGVPAGEDEGGNRPDQRRRLRKSPPDMQGTAPRPYPGRSRDNSPSFVARGPPASRSVATSNLGPSSGMGVPGGMI